MGLVDKPDGPMVPWKVADCQGLALLELSPQMRPAPLALLVLWLPYSKPLSLNAEMKRVQVLQQREAPWPSGGRPEARS